MPSSAKGGRVTASREASDDVVLRTRGLSKNYGRLRAVDGLDLEVRRGDVFGFLGPNGAGKSTTIRMITGLIRPAAGSVELFGCDARSHRHEVMRRVGAIVEEPAFYRYLSGRRNLEILAAMSGGAPRERINEVLDVVGLSDRARDKVAKYSHGMRQRLGIAQALLPRPELVVLDEPTTGLDPQGMKEVRDLVRDLAERERVTVFLSSHLLHEVEQVCNRAAVIHRGKLITAGEVADIKRDEAEIVRIAVDDPERASALLGGQPWVSAIGADGDRLRVRMAHDRAADANALLVQAGLRVWALEPEQRSLEDAFFALLNGSSNA
jgi:ABC-2 type transport system ATP-binding protein